MTSILPTPFISISPTTRGRMTSAGAPLSVGAFRLPTDAIYYFDLTLENIIVGSRYRVTRHDTGAELATGVAASTSEVVAGVPAYSAGMLMDITVRNASGTPAFKIFDTAAYASPDGTSAYILQQPDE